MPGSPYSAAHSMGPTSPYARPGPVAPMYAVPVYPPTPPNGTPPLHAYYAHQHPYFYGGIIYAQPPYHPQGHVFDRPPPQMNNPHAPPGHPGHPMLAHHPGYAPHPAHAQQQQQHQQQYMATPPQRAPSTAEQAQHQPQAPPPPPASTVPEQGPQLPAINGTTASAASLPTPEPSDKATSQSSDSTASRPLPTLGSLLNGDGPEKENQSNSRSGSRSPNTASRFPRDLAPERLAKNSTAADSSALNKLNSVFVRS
jgi:hypothetical protein